MSYIVNLEQIGDYNTHKLIVNPKRTALIVIEMQNVFLNDLNMISDKQLDNIKTNIDASEKAGVNIIYVRHNDSAEISKSMVDWWSGEKAENTILDLGNNNTLFQVSLDLCYLNSQINSQLGNCYYKIILFYIEKRLSISSLQNQWKYTTMHTR